MSFLCFFVASGLLRRKLLKQCFRVAQVARVESFREPIVSWRQNISCVAGPVLRLIKSSQADRRPPLPRFRGLTLRNLNRLLKTLFSRGDILRVCLGE